MSRQTDDNLSYFRGRQMGNLFFLTARAVTARAGAVHGFSIGVSYKLA